MSTWHQERAGTSNLALPGKGYVLVSEGTFTMRTSMGFGDNQKEAIDSLDKHRENQPRLFHYLYKDGQLIA